MWIWICGLFHQGNTSKREIFLAVVKKHFEGSEGSSDMRLARSWGGTKLSAGLLVT